MKEQYQVSNWKRVYRIILIHGFRMVKTRGLMAQEIAVHLLKSRKKYLTADEIKYLKGLLK